MFEAIQKINTKDVLKIIFSNPNLNNEYKKIEFENKVDYFKETAFTQKNALTKVHKNFDFLSTLKNLLFEYKQINIFCTDFEYNIKISKKNKIFLFKQQTKTTIVPNAAHNREKNYIIKEGSNIPALVDMGIFTKELKIASAMHDKFRQINRFLEIIDDVISKSNLKKLNIVDFGCGKSYLTFVVYHYLKFIKKIDINMVGLDLKEDVIKKCNQTAQKYGYENLRFFVGDIKDFDPDFDIDMIVTLHACDTATDYALYNAIKWNVGMIFSVPCCQHEINQQIKSKDFDILNKYGIAKERMSAIFTDIIRCNLLKSQGYQVDLMEFIDFEATPKNLLIRAFKTKIPANIKKEMVCEVEDLAKEFGFEQTLFGLLKKDKLI